MGELVTSERPTIMLSAGEPSGDLHGAMLCRALREQAPELSLTGMGGARMAAAGMRVLVDPTARAGVGGVEIMGRLPSLFRAYQLLGDRLRALRPRALVVIDFPEFNMRLARAARRAGVPVIYFIPPQVWAWRPWRARTIAGLVSRVLAVFPFERALYERAGAAVEFVGHPLLDALPFDLSRVEARRRLGLEPDESVVGLLPGSRHEELERLLPPMVEATRDLGVAHPRRRFLVGVAASVEPERVLQILRRTGANESARLELREARTYEIMTAADALLVASGTATLEAALLGAPMVVCYRVPRLSELVVRALVRVPWISLPNLVARRALVPELLQDDVSGPRLAAEARRLLEEPEAARAQRAGFAAVRAALGEPGVGWRAAAAVLETARAA
jgi:lipid-A-disaccharide synthase